MVATSDKVVDKMEIRFTTFFGLANQIFLSYQFRDSCSLMGDQQAPLHQVGFLKLKSWDSWP